MNGTGTFSGVIQNGANASIALTVAGGTVTLSGNNTYSGGTTITSGTLQIGQGGTTGSLGSGSVSDNGSLVFDLSSNTSVANAISGSGGLIQQGSGTTTLTAANTYTGATTINAGTLQVGVANAIGSSSAVTLANAAGAALDLHNFNDTIASLSGGGSTGGNVTLGSGTLTIGGNATTTYSGIISGTGGLQLSGGTLVLAGANTYTGSTTINAGTLQITGSLASTAITVNSPGALLVTVVNTSDSGVGSLRQALTTINDTSGVTPTISFNIAGSGVQTISPLTAFPAITSPVVIDGYTQPGASVNTLTAGDNAVLQIEINGTNVSGDGLHFQGNGGGSTVRGLVIDRFGGSALYTQTTVGNVFVGNFLGTNAAGTSALGNGTGVRVNSGTGNTIGGTTPANANVISGNVTGIQFGSGANNNLVVGNYVGTDWTGAAALGNGTGIFLQGNTNTIGGTTAGSGNVISGNTGDGIDVRGNTNVVIGNFIGVNAAGGAALGNGLSGVHLELALPATPSVARRPPPAIS